MSKIISEESPDVTIAQLRNKLKCFEAGQATAKYIKSGDAKEVHQIKKTQKQRNQGADKAPSLKMTLATITKVKRTITGNNHRENVSNLPVKQQCQLQRISFMVMVNKQRKLTQALA